MQKLRQASFNYFYKLAIPSLIYLMIFARIYLYIYYKSVWLDEAALAEGVYKLDWTRLLLGQLGYGQSAPIFFAALGKILSHITSYSEHALHLIPLVSGFATIYFLYKIGGIIGDDLYTFILLSMFCVSIPPVFYSVEFKQYSTELFFTCVLIYLFLNCMKCKNYEISLKHFLIFIFALFSANTSIFIVVPYLATIFFLKLTTVKNMREALHCKALYQIIIFSVIYVTIIIIYYLLYLKTNAAVASTSPVSQTLIPTNVKMWPNYFSGLGFTFFHTLIGWGGGGGEIKNLVN
jgi:hypothetical protein